MEEGDHRLTQLFGVLSNPIRLRILKLLREDAHTVTELSETLEQQSNTVSNHLRILREHDLVHARSEGSRRLYRLKRDDLVDACLNLRDFLTRP